MHEPDVCVVGAGPVGLTVALGLARAGVAVTVLEQDRTPSTEWRASTFHPPTLEMCERMGVVDEMIQAGLVAPTYQVRGWKEGSVAEFDLAVLGDVTKYPFRLQLEQYKYSAILRDRIGRHDSAQIRYGCAFTGLRQSGPDVVVEFSEGVDNHTMRARLIVGTDGASSAVRGALKLGFEGITYPRRHLIVSLDVPLHEWYPDLSYVNYISDVEDHPGMLLKIPDVWRVSVSVPDDISDATALSDVYISRRLQGIFPERSVPAPTARQLFRVHQRLAETFRVGSALLAGDAAHVNNPKGGMGLNSGIHDAVDLVGVLPDVLQGNAPDSTLDEWAARRREVYLKDVVRITHRNATEMDSSDSQKLTQKLTDYADLATDPDQARAFLLESSMIQSVAFQREQLGARF